MPPELVTGTFQSWFRAAVLHHAAVAVSAGDAPRPLRDHGVKRNTLVRLSISTTTLSLALGLLACGAGNDEGARAGTLEATAAAEAPLALAAGSGAAGTVPAGLGARMNVGLFENLAGTWLKSSGAKWDMRYAYFGMGWLNRWGYGPADGQSALDYMKECDAQGFVPVIQYYVLREEPPQSDESQTYAKTQNPAVMKDYWNQYKVLMQRAKEFGKPVVIITEGDGFGFLEKQSGDNPSAPAAIASSGVAELAGLPNTVAGFGMGFLQMRRAVGAINAIVGPDVPIWATGDISYYQVGDALQPHVDKQYAFLSALGLGANATGATFDFTAADPLDADSDWWKVLHGQDKWWDTSDTAAITTKSFNRYAEWLRLFNRKSQRRWILWQVPCGNSNHLNVNNGGNPREGYKDNRPEYFFGTSRDAHLTKFAEAGVFALLFGMGEAGVASYTNDTYTDGQLFLKSRAGGMLNAGGFPIARGDGSVTPPAPKTDGGSGTGTDGGTGTGGGPGTGPGTDGGTGTIGTPGSGGGGTGTGSGSGTGTGSGGDGGNAEDASAGAQGCAVTRGAPESGTRGLASVGALAALVLAAGRRGRRSRRS